MKGLIIAVVMAGIAAGALAAEIADLQRLRARDLSLAPAAGARIPNTAAAGRTRTEFSYWSDEAGRQDRRF
ncbi:MAG: hypothetical protein M0011_03835 [Elusimicrobia bacterium]|nr:hypothetical protein [Elusimicrobiota bacterium]